MDRRLLMSVVTVVALGVGGCTTRSAAESATGTPIVAETTPPTTVNSADRLLRTLVSTEWEVVSLGDTLVADRLDPVSVRFWGDGTYTFRGSCPSGTYEVNGSNVDFAPGGGGDGPALVDPPEATVLLMGRLCSIVDHGMTVSSFNDREIQASTVFPRAFALVLRPTTAPAG